MSTLARVRVISSEGWNCPVWLNMADTPSSLEENLLTPCMTLSLTVLQGRHRVLSALLAANLRNTFFNPEVEISPIPICEEIPWLSSPWRKRIMQRWNGAWNHIQMSWVIFRGFRVERHPVDPLSKADHCPVRANLPSKYRIQMK